MHAVGWLAGKASSVALWLWANLNHLIEETMNSEGKGEPTREKRNLQYNQFEMSL